MIMNKKLSKSNAKNSNITFILNNMLSSNKPPNDYQTYMIFKKNNIILFDT